MGRSAAGALVVIRLSREKPGALSPGTCWVLVHSCYMYTRPTLIGTLWQALTQWCDDRHLVG